MRSIYIFSGHLFKTNAVILHGGIVCLRTECIRLERKRRPTGHNSSSYSISPTMSQPNYPNHGHPTAVYGGEYSKVVPHTRLPPFLGD